MHDGTFPVELVTGVPVVAAPEEIDITNAPQLLSALLEAISRGSGTLVADLTGTRFCDSSGIKALIAAHKRAHAEGGELLLAVCSAQVLRVFTITGIDQQIPCLPSVQDALADTVPSGSGAGDRLEDSAGSATGTAG